MNCLTELVAKFIKVNFHLGFLANKKIIKNKISLDDVKKQLIALGIKEGDAIMVHSSLSQISAKAPEMIKLLQELVGVNGNILMPTHPILSETESGLLIYDPANSKSKVGYLTDYFRQMPDVKRSLHPFSSIAVWGKDKEFFLENNISDNSPLPHGKNSPYAKFAEVGGKSVFIGVSAKNRGTIKHTAEEILDDQFALNIFEEIEVGIKLDDSIEKKKFRRTILAFSETYKCNSRLMKEFLKWGILQKTQVLTVPIEVLDAKKCVDLMLKSILDGKTPYPFAPRKYYRVK